MTEDLRSQRMPSAEGRGLARKAWDGYQSGARRVLEPMLDPVARRYGAGAASEMVGFWLLWHLHGGFEGLQRMGMPRTTIFRKVKRFREAFGMHPDEYEFAGVSIDQEAYWATAGEAERERTLRVAALKAAKAAG